MNAYVFKTVSTKEVVQRSLVRSHFVFTLIAGRPSGLEILV